MEHRFKLIRNQGKIQQPIKNRRNHRLISSVVIYLLLITFPMVAQDLDPRAYARVPIHATTLVTGFSYSFGGVVTDPTLPVQNIEAHVQTPSIGIAHSFSLFKLTSQALVALPYSWAQVSGDVANQAESITRSGFSDTRLRLSVLVHGAPAATLSEVMKAPRKTVVGVSLSMIVPTGQFFSDKLINLGTNRFSFKPEVALSHPFSKRWLIDVYAGAWFFTKNRSFYPGNSVRTQEPMGTFQAHLSYNIKALLWVAFDATYYVGGQSSVNDIYNDDRQSNSRLGATAVLPVGKRNSLKFSFSRGAIVRIGQNFTTFSIGWQTTWIGKNNG